MNTTLEEVTAVEDIKAQNALTFLNMTGDITITWDDQNAEKIKDLIRKKLRLDRVSERAIAFNNANARFVGAFQ